MKKRFAITLIILSTLVYGGMFFMATYYGTGFFDEILIQLNRMTIGLSKKQEVAQSKFILKTILENEHPPGSWKGLMLPSPDHQELFYHYKIWTLKTKLTHEDIHGSYPIFESKKNNFTLINMRYGNTKPVVQFPFLTDKAGYLITGLFFPINEKPLSADYNRDNRVTYEDVLLAREREQ